MDSPTCKIQFVCYLQINHLCWGLIISILAIVLDFIRIYWWPKMSFKYYFFLAIFTFFLQEITCFILYINNYHAYNFVQFQSSLAIFRKRIFCQYFEFNSDTSSVFLHFYYFISLLNHFKLKRTSDVIG